MKKRFSNLEFSIPGDELEHHRIQLENNLQHTDFSLHLSSAPDEPASESGSVEYPRHTSVPSPFSAFASFDNPSRDNLDFDSHSHLHAWSYHDEDGVNPYGAETMSTAAHHASALTLSAGLGGRGGRRDISLSGAEYDPDRPLQQIIEGMNGQLSAIDSHYHTKSGMQVGSNFTFDPLVVDNTSDIDRILPSGHAASLTSLAVRLRSPNSSADSSSTESDGLRLVSPRPRLSDTLHRVSFSPKRPRNGNVHSRVSTQSSLHGQTRASIHPSVLRNSEAGRRHASSHSKGTGNEHHASSHSRIHADPDYAPGRRGESRAGPLQPEVLVQPPTPSATSSKFTRMARDLAREIQEEQSHRIVDLDASTVTNASKNLPMRGDRKQKMNRNPFGSIVNHSGTEVTADEAHSIRDFSKISHRRLHLPDVTGLTSAVASPAKNITERYGVSGGHEQMEIEARLIASLNALHSRLAQLESQNSIARRRVRELELELEQCKDDVAKERTRVMAREELVPQSRRSNRPENSGKDRQRSLDGSNIAMDRYREVVEEKKALEALIASLRLHLTRLTTDLSSQQQILGELRSLRESDAKTLAEKSQEINQLREEVERLAGEIEVLRGVVEEGLQERRLVREQLSMRAPDQAIGALNQQQGELEGQRAEAEEDYIHSSSRPQSPVIRRATPTPRRTSFSRVHSPNGTNLMNRPPSSLSSSHAGSSRPFVDPEELDRISVELEERRSDRSSSSSRTNSRVHDHSAALNVDQRITSSRRTSTNGSIRSDNRSLRESVRGFGSEGVSVPERGDDVDPLALSKLHHQEDDIAQPLPAVSGRSAQPPIEKITQIQRSAGSDPVTPFPRIRSGHLERLFFSAPEHNAKTCTVCHRRRRPLSVPKSSFKPRPPKAHVETEDNDEGFHEGSESDTHQHGDIGVGAKDKGKQREHDALQSYDSYEELCSGDALPPQTVLSRVLRELEDDFAHYKSIYVELADQYRLMDAVSNVPKRNTLAEHLKEVIDILERKGDQIASLYDLLAFKDKPVAASAGKTHNHPRQGTTIPGSNQYTHALVQGSKDGLHVHA